LVYKSITKTAQKLLKAFFQNITLRILVNRTAIILANDISEVTKQDILSLEFNRKPLIVHIVEKVSDAVDEIIVVSKSEESIEKHLEVLDTKTIYLFEENQDILRTSLSAFEKAKGKYSLLLSYNFPLVSLEVIDLLFELCYSRSAVIPRWPDQQIEPTQAVYRTETAIEAAKIALIDELFTLEDMIEDIGGIRYISTLAIQELDPQLKTFFRVKTPIDLTMAERMLKPKPAKGKNFKRR
jgi:molybdenum cofactor guanylyltransferase